MPPQLLTLLADESDSMKGGPISQVNSQLANLTKELGLDPFIQKRSTFNWFHSAGG